MGKHSLEKEKKKSKTKDEKKKINFKKEIIAVLIIIILVFGINFILSHKKIQKEQEYVGITVSKTIEGEKLVFKSTTEKCRIMEYTFENNILKQVKIYHEFEDKESFEQKKKSYETVDNITVLNTNEQNLSIEIEKKDFGSDTGKSYEETYDKYLVQIIGAYEIIK